MGCLCLRKAKGDTNCNIIANGNASYLDATLTHQQKRILRDNWTILSSDLEEKGKKIFLKIFDKNPFIKGLFPFRHLEGDELKNDSTFRAHAQRFTNTLGLVMENLDRYREEVAPQLVALGRRHACFPGFKPSYFNHFEEAMLDVFKQELGPMLFDAKSVEAWRVIFRFILMELKRGFTLALRDRSKLQREQQNHAGLSHLLCRKTQKLH